MKAVDQRYYRGQLRPMGDCVAACVASIFELSLDEVPHFVEIMYQRQARHDVEKEWEQSWWGLLNRWAWDFGIGVNRLTYSQNNERISSKVPLHYHPGYWIGSVESRDPALAEMANTFHAIVMQGYDVVHDPNPDSRVKKIPYRFCGETWFELAHPELWIDKIEWREIMNMRLTA